jgi:hypothetical protein
MSSSAILVIHAQKNGAHDETNAGERWGCLVQDRPSRFIAACAAGRIGDDLIGRAVMLTVTRTQGRGLAWCSDGWRGYAAILKRAYRQPSRSGKPGRPRLVVPSDVRLTQTIKHRDEHGKLLSTRASVLPWARWFLRQPLSMSSASTAQCVIGSMP